MTDKPVALKFPIELEFRNCCGGRKTRECGEKPSEQNPLMTPSPGFESGPHWGEASVITTAPVSKVFETYLLVSFMEKH